MSANVQVPCPHCVGVVRVPYERLGDGPRCPQCHHPLFEGQPVNLDLNSFERHVQHSDLPLVIDFWAPWCGPCRAMAPAFEAAAQRMEPQVRFVKINTDEVPELANRYGIRGIPTVVIVKNGKELARQSGAISREQLQQWVTQALA